MSSIYSSLAVRSGFFSFSIVFHLCKNGNVVNSIRDSEIRGGNKMPYTNFMIGFQLDLASILKNKKCDVIVDIDMDSREYSCNVDGNDVGVDGVMPRDILNVIINKGN